MSKTVRFFTMMMLSAISLHASPPITNSLYDHATFLSEIFMKRHSGTHFETHAIAKEQISTLIQSARWSPSSYNDQPWNFIFCDRFENPEAYLKAFDAIYGQDWIENVPLFVIVIARSEFRYNQEWNDWALYDTGAAAFAMSLQASEMGLMAHQIGGFDKEAILQEFQIPQGCVPLSIIAIGYENLSAPPEEPRTRYPTTENFFSGEWGRPFVAP